MLPGVVEVGEDVLAGGSPQPLVVVGPPPAPRAGLAAMTGLTPLRPRSASARRKSHRKTSASKAPVATPGTSRRPAVSTATATVTATLTRRPPRRDCRWVASIRRAPTRPAAWGGTEVRSAPLDRPGRKGPDALVDLAAEPADPALRDAGAAQRWPGGHRSDSRRERARAVRAEAPRPGRRPRGSTRRGRRPLGRRPHAPSRRSVAAPGAPGSTRP